MSLAVRIQSVLFFPQRESRSALQNSLEKRGQCQMHNFTYWYWMMGGRGWVTVWKCSHSIKDNHQRQMPDFDWFLWAFRISFSVINRNITYHLQPFKTMTATLKQVSNNTAFFFFFCVFVFKWENKDISGLRWTAVQAYQGSGFIFFGLWLLERKNTDRMLWRHALSKPPWSTTILFTQRVKKALNK